MGYLDRLLYRAVRKGIRKGVREISKRGRRKRVGRHLQKEAAARPESELVSTPAGDFWMSPIEAKLYDAMAREGLSPTPQFMVEGYYVDFAFPRSRLAIEADGAEYHSGELRKRDRKRDWILGRKGWKVLRFYGKTIHQKAGNCVYVIKKELKARR